MVEKNVVNLAEKIVKTGARAAKKVSAAPKIKSEIITMQCDKITQPIGPFSLGKIISQPGLGTWAYSAGMLGLSPKTN